MEETKNILNKETLIPISLVITVLGCVFWLGTTVQRLNDMETRIMQITDNERRLSILESRQGVSEAQFAQINESFTEIKLDIKAIQKALTITP